MVDLLLNDDKLLSRRDAEAKLNKIRNKRNLRQRIFVFQEIGEGEENFKAWWRQDLKNAYFAMYARHRTCYRKGDQLLNSYGMRNNRFLLTNYGFAMRRNKYNSLGLKVFVNFTSEGQTGPSRY